MQWQTPSPSLSLGQFNVGSMCHVPRLHCAKSGSKLFSWTTPRAPRVCVCVCVCFLCAFAFVCPSQRNSRKKNNYNDDGLMDQNGCAVCPGECQSQSLSYCVHSAVREVDKTSSLPLPPLLVALPRGTGQSLFTFWLYLFVLMFFGYYQDHLIYN